MLDGDLRPATSFPGDIRRAYVTRRPPQTEVQQITESVMNQQLFELRSR